MTEPVDRLPATAADLRRKTPLKRTINQQVEDLLVDNYEQLKPWIRGTHNEDAVEGSVNANQYRLAMYLIDAAAAGSDVRTATLEKVRASAKTVLDKYGLSRKELLALEGNGNGHHQPDPESPEA